jgi:hypothetical protein
LNDYSFPTKYTEWHEIQKVNELLLLHFRVFRGAIIDNHFHFRISASVRPAMSGLPPVVFSQIPASFVSTAMRIRFSQRK